jgi:AraC-like DNA-binding protein
MPSDLPLVRWSAEQVDARHRVDLYAATLSESMAPMHMSAPRKGDFMADVWIADAGALQFYRQRGSAHRCYQDKLDAARAAAHTYHIILNHATPWNLEHRMALHMEPGDAVVVDAGLPWAIASPDDYDYLNVTMADGWLRQWVPSPVVLTSRRIIGQAGWGRALAAFAAQLSPQFIVDSPLPQSIIVDHVGALLALAAGELTGQTIVPTSGMKALDARIEDCIQERCAEPMLTAEQVAAAVGVSVRTLHRCLSTAGKSFGALLIDARADVGIRMLGSSLLRRLTVAEIGRRAGFIDASHFARVVRRRTGRTPLQLRQAHNGKALAEPPADA